MQSPFHTNKQDMDILLISNEDTCRSRIAEALLDSFGRGMKFFTSGIKTPDTPWQGVPDAVINVLSKHHLEARGQKPHIPSSYNRTQ